MCKRLHGGRDADVRQLDVELVEDFDRFQSLKEKWDILSDKAVESFPMVTHSWLSAWWNTFADGRRPYIILVWNADDLVGAAALLSSEKKLSFFNYRVLEPWANSWVDRFTFLAKEPVQDIVDAIVDHLIDARGNWDLLELSPLERNSYITRCFQDSLNKRELTYGVEGDLRSPFLILPKTWDQLLTQVSSSFRQNVRRKLRSAKKMNGVSTKVVTGKECLAPIVEISLESWQHANGTSIASEPEILEFYTRIISDYAERGDLRCALMEVDGEPAAFELNLKHRNTLHNFKLGFKKKFSHISTGIVLKSHLLHEALEGERRDPEIVEYDFMGTSEPYKLNWSKMVRHHDRYLVFSDRPESRWLHWSSYKVKPFVRDQAPVAFAFAKRCANYFRRRKSLVK